MRSRQPDSLTQAVYRAVRADLLACRTRPGEKLRIAVLCDRHGASSGAVREALSRLTAEGLVTLEPQRGFQAGTISADGLADLTVARVEVESLCLRMAIENGDLGWEERLLGSAHRLRRTPWREPGDTARIGEAWVNAHEVFHEALVAACPNQTLLRIRSQLYAQSERYRSLSVPLADVDRDVEAEHRGLMLAALDRDKDRAVKAIAYHINETTRILLRAHFNRAEMAA
ncbi:GntR family transcriptional regulator [Lichenicoccus sp.]|uniref:GntR family transcriptional regulator n=1 Tax=Lichenicoccus sp. TaxID=2781899 RepID=UPI003D0A5DA8